MADAKEQTAGFLCSGCGVVGSATEDPPRNPRMPAGWLQGYTDTQTRFVVCSRECGDRLLDRLTMAEVDRHHERMAQLGRMRFLDEAAARDAWRSRVPVTPADVPA